MVEGEVDESVILEAREIRGFGGRRDSGKVIPRLDRASSVLVCKGCDRIVLHRLIALAGYFYERPLLVTVDVDGQTIAPQWWSGLPSSRANHHHSCYAALREGV